VGLKDYCLGGDFSPSYYDGICRPAGMTTDDLETRVSASSDHGSATETESASSSGENEYMTAYQWAKQF
jgi:hypothetical protein